MHGRRTSGQAMRAAFYRLHAATMEPATTALELAAALTNADALAERHRVSEAAVYATALARYAVLAGRSWKDEQRTTGDTTWGEGSDHRYRLNARDGGLVARCSCGARAEVASIDAGDQWHAEHVGVTV